MKTNHLNAATAAADAAAAASSPGTQSEIDSIYTLRLCVFHPLDETLTFMHAPVRSLGASCIHMRIRASVHNASHVTVVSSGFSHLCLPGELMPRSS